MIYIVTLAVLIVLVLQFDYKSGGYKQVEFNNKVLTRYDLWYRITLIWFICVSGFAYNVGSDVPNYMREYYNFCTVWNVNSLKDFFEFDNRQPGWVLLNVICSSISDNFVLLKFVVSIFVNWTVFRFFKKYIKYVFTGILFYAIFLYLALNFNALRQAVAVGFFLIGYDFLLDKRWIKYYLFAFLSFMFHSSGIICFFIPILSCIKFNRIVLIIFAVILVAGTVYSLTSDVLQNLAASFILSEYGGDTISELGTIYMENADDRVGALNLFGILMVVFNVCIVLFVMLFTIRKGNEEPMMVSMISGYTIFYVISFAIPLIFERFLYFFYPFYICGIVKIVIEFPRIFKGIRAFLTIVVTLFFCYTPMSNLFAENVSSGIPLINQFAPYYSVFNPKIDPIRASNFGYWK